MSHGGPHHKVVGFFVALKKSAFICNLPLGRWRAAARKFSRRWFVVALRLGMGISAWFIPLSCGAAMAGQVAGGPSNLAVR